MIIKKVNISVVIVSTNDSEVNTIIESYKGYDTLPPVYTIINENALGTTPHVQSNKSGEWLNDYFNHDITSLFDED